MKKIALLALLVLLMSLFVNAQAAPWTFCERWDCLGDDHKDWFVTGRSDPTNWDKAIWSVDPETVEDSGEHVWENYCENNIAANVAIEIPDLGPIGDPFSLSYDPDTGLVTFIIDEQTLTYTYDTDKAYDHLVLMSKGNEGGNMALIGLELDGMDLPEVVSQGNYQGLIVPMSDGMQQDGFTLTGWAAMCWYEKTTQEIPGFHVFAMNTHPLPPDDIPEFGILGAVAVLGLAGLFVARRRK